MTPRLLVAALLTSYLLGLAAGAALTFFAVPMPDEGETLARVWLDPLRTQDERQERMLDSLAEGRGWE